MNHPIDAKNSISVPIINGSADASLHWEKPAFHHRDLVKKAVFATDYLGSDSAFSNIYLLRNKYKLKICFYDGLLLRYYNGPYGRRGYTFPLGQGNVREALLALKRDSIERGVPFSFCFLTEDQKAFLEEVFPGSFRFMLDEGDTDYIYLTEPLSKLSGRKYHKHKNHFLKFQKTYDNIRMEPLSQDTKKDALKVSITWYEDHETSESLLHEKASLLEALEHIDQIGLEGSIIYVGSKAVAMSVVSPINKDIYDINYEKAIGEYAVNGAYSAICSSTAAQLIDYTYINREEDLGIEGLRQSKLSYRPALLYTKYKAVPL